MAFVMAASGRETLRPMKNASVPTMRMMATTAICICVVVAARDAAAKASASARCCSTAPSMSPIIGSSAANAWDIVRCLSASAKAPFIQAKNSLW